MSDGQPHNNVITLPQREKPQASPFDALAKRLEERLARIENDLKDGLGALESDLSRMSRRRPKAEGEAWRADIDSLSRRLEERIRLSLERLALADPKPATRAESGFIASLASQLGNLLSLDFFRGVLGRLDTPTDDGEVDEFGMDPVAVAQLKPVFDFLYFKYWRVRTTGIENIPNTGRALIVGNHSGTLPYDGAMLATAIVNEHPVRHDARFLVENFVYHMPMLGTLMYRIGGVRACPENAERLLTRGHLVVVFPEGVKGIGKFFRDRYKLQRFGRGGFIKLCITTHSPLIPVGIVGAEEIHPILFKSNALAKTIGVPYIPITPTFPLFGLLGMIPLPTKWSIHFGKPVSFAQYSRKTLDDEIAIHKLSETVRGEIQEILLDLLRKRRSVWWG